METSRSTKSGSGSRKPVFLKRSTVLKRGCSYALLTEQHFKYIWAAYKRGADLSSLGIGPDLKADEFRNILTEKTITFIRSGAELYVLEGKTVFGIIPIGLVAARFEGHIASPEAVFFPDASPRNIFECSIKFLVDLKKTHKIVFASKPVNWRFYNHICKYGVIRRFGTCKGYYRTEDAGFYESV